MERQEQIWQQKIRTAITQLQIMYIKPITELTEAFENYLNVLEMKKQREMLKVKEKIPSKDNK